MTRTSETVFAPAKLNLFLHVTGRWDSGPKAGLHALQSLFVFLTIGDELSFHDQGQRTPTPTQTKTHSEEPGADLIMRPDLGVSRADNLAWKAWQAVRACAPDLPPPLIEIHKVLPAEAGLGGGTANAAAVVHWAERQAPEIPFREALAPLGADMPPAMDQRARLWQGTGDEPGAEVPGLRGTPVLLLKPPTGLATGACFAALQGQFTPRFDFDPAGDLEGQLRRARNDLQGPAQGLNADVAQALQSLSRLPGAWLVRMTGSGSTCFALFHEKGPRDAALNAVRQAHPTWWSAGAEIR